MRVHTLFYDYVADVSGTLKERHLRNHDLIYFDEIGLNFINGVICSGVVSDICCTDFDPLSENAKRGIEPNGNGSWIYPNDLYVKRDCTGCTGVELDSFRLQRTSNSTILFRNENTTLHSPGIYRCEVPLNTSDPRILYVGIFERGEGKLNDMYIYFYEHNVT